MDGWMKIMVIMGMTEEEEEEEGENHHGGSLVGDRNFCYRMSWTSMVRYDDDGVGGWFRLVVVDWLGFHGLIPGGKQGLGDWYRMIRA